ncbi:MAG: 30S ribosomal protein S11 [Candidatus Harrisonbacteria bacterium RIFCSPLOWO2_02_FULL_41_13b]|uniref:Small ribosomal subunit protein uS11 n=1 Tax=Candidatus Harrisonbacteria bacterium RIFCSPLOWO2_02_FULL_41_13b TaxID=1798409 RepID=A0A1G1ZT19_9BACT|nr:MAG: 30S ribosomal protein S11 [Candidatus Harrisonbacteria bacterium RIFCSPLOWO2_02_FULL_41_13b]
METAVASEKSKSVSKKIENGRIYINASFNNTIISITDDKGNALAWSSAGTLGFAGPKKATPFAASKVVAALAEKLRNAGPVNVAVFLNGVSSARDSALRSLSNHGFNIISIKDVTPVPHNGPRPAKVRRV